MEEALKSSIFIVQKAAAPKSGVEFRQGSNGTIRSCLATSYDVSRRRARSPNFDQSEAEKLSQTDTHTHRESTYCQALLYEQSSACKKYPIGYQVLYHSFTFRNQMYIARLFLLPYLIGCKALNYPIVSL